MKKLGMVLLCAVLSGQAIVQSGCAPKGTSAGYSKDVTYGGSGSAWSATLKNDLTFSITKKANTTSTTTDMTVTGTFERLTSGFLRLTVATCKDANNATCSSPVAGDKAYALDIVGYVLLLKPMNSSGGEIIPMMATGTCPSADFNGSWVIMQDSGTSSNYTTSALAGTFVYTNSSSSAALGSTSYLSSGSSTAQSNTSLGAFTCSGGIGTLPSNGNGSPEMWFTSGGGSIVRVPYSASGTQGVVMVNSAALTVSDFAGDYIGLYFDEGNTSDSGSSVSGGVTKAVSATLASGGTGTGAVLSDIVAGTRDSNQSASLTLANLSTPVNGIAKMTVGSQSYICVAAKSPSKMIFCASPSSNGNQYLNSYLLVQKP